MREIPHSAHPAPDVIQSWSFLACGQNFPTMHLPSTLSSDTTELPGMTILVLVVWNVYPFVASVVQFLLLMASAK